MDEQVIISEQVVCAREVLHVPTVCLMFVVGVRMTGLFLRVAVERFMDGDIIIGDSLGASKVLKLKFPPHVKPLQHLDLCS